MCRSARSEIFNQSAKENGAKIHFYTENSTTHKQCIIEGKRPSGAKWRLICDEELVDVLTALNNAGVSTLWSCQGEGLYTGSITGKPTFVPGYITIRYPKSRSLFMLANLIVKQHFKNCVILQTIDDTGRVNFKIYDVEKYNLTSKQIVRMVVQNKAEEIVSEAHIVRD